MPYNKLPSPSASTLGTGQAGLGHKQSHEYFLQSCSEKISQFLKFPTSLIKTQKTIDLKTVFIRFVSDPTNQVQINLDVSNQFLLSNQTI